MPRLCHEFSLVAPLQKSILFYNVIACSVLPETGQIFRDFWEKLRVFEKCLQNTGDFQYNFSRFATIKKYTFL